MEHAVDNRAHKGTEKEFSEWNPWEVSNTFGMIFEMSFEMI